MSNTVDLIASASRFAIAAAIVYFAYQLTQINDNVPVVMESVERVSQQIEPALVEAKEIRAEIAEVRKLVPEVLAEVAEVRKQIPVMVGEVTEVRRQIPPLLTQVETINKQIEPILKRADEAITVVNDTQRQIPQIIEATDNAITAINQTRAQIVPLVPLTLEEIRLTREKIDPTLDRVDGLVEDAYFKATNAIGAADKAGQEASEGAVKGFFTGLIKLPFQLVGTLASPIVKNIDPDVAEQINEKDIELMVEAGNTVIKTGKVDRERGWENPDSGNSGSIAITRYFELKGLECVEARVRINNRRKQIQDKRNEFCRNAEGKWTLAGEIEG
ncbi:MAG: hypothetical protein OEV07_06825 [Gammaproteobacteria bacterium]|nr:hypothetical protein [Gammaproteobacteria bacterium]